MAANPQPPTLLHRLKFPLTSIAIGLTIAVVGAEAFWHANLVELPLAFFAGIEQNEVDDIVTLLVIIGLAFLLDHGIAARRAAAEAETARTRAVESTMISVTNIVDSFLAQLQLLRLEEAKDFGRIEAVMFESAVRETSAKLKALAALKN
jgi:hypothetical protein